MKYVQIDRYPPAPTPPLLCEKKMIELYSRSQHKYEFLKYTGCRLHWLSE